MKSSDWYFDFVSPFSYLQSERLAEIDVHITLNYRPVLFAGLLKHWNQLGPAEIPGKRTFTYRYTQWLAERYGIVMTFPRAHPFNPLSALRLAILAACTAGAVSTIFRFIWREGRLPDDENNLEHLAERLGIDEVRSRIADPAVKQTLLDNTAEAIDRNVFGVPTFVIDDECFWGNDALDLFLAYCTDPNIFHTPEMQRVAQLPIGVQRSR